MKKKIEYFCLTNEKTIFIKKDKTNDQVGIYVNEQQKVFYPNLISYIKQNNEHSTLLNSISKIITKIELRKKMVDSLLREQSIDNILLQSDIHYTSRDDSDEIFFNKYCSKMKFYYTNENILKNKQTYTEEELFISRFIEQCGIKRYKTFKFDQYVDCCMYDCSIMLKDALVKYSYTIGILLKCIKQLYVSVTTKQTKLSLYEMKIMKFLISFKAIFYLITFHTKYQDLQYKYRAPRDMKKRIDDAMSDASKILDMYFVKNVKSDNVKLQSFFSKLTTLSFDDKIGNTDFLNEFDSSIDMLCNEEIILPEMMKLSSFQYILPNNINSELVLMMKAYSFFLLNYKTPQISDYHYSEFIRPFEGNFERYAYHWNFFGLQFDNLDSIYIKKIKNKNISFFETDMLSLDYIELVIDSCLDISHNYDMFRYGSGHELLEYLRFLGLEEGKENIEYKHGIKECIW